VWQVVFSPDSKTLLTGSGDDSGGEGRLYDAVSGQLLASWTHPSGVLSAVFNPRGRTCLTLSVEEAIIRSIPEGKAVGLAIKHPRPERPDPKNPVPLTGDFSPDGKRIVTAGEDGTARFWDAATGEPQDKVLHTASPILTVAFSPDGSTLLTGGLHGNVRIWDAATGQPRSPVLPHQGPVLAVAFSPDGQIAATAGIVREVNQQTQEAAFVGGEVRLWRVPSGASLGPALLHPAPVRSLAFSPKGRRLLSGCEDGNARLFLVATGEQMGKFFAFSGSVTQVAFSPDGMHCLTADAGGGVPRYARLWQVAPEDHLPRLLLHNDFVSALKFSPDGRSLLSGGDDNCAQLWDVATGRPKGPPLPHPYPITIATFSPDGRSLFTFCDDSHDHAEAALWDLNRGQKRHIIRVPQRVHSAAFCDDGRALLTGDSGGNLRLYDASSGEPTGKPLKENAAVSSLEFSRDEQTVLVGLDNGGAVLWDWKARRQLRKLPLGEGATYGYFYPDKSGLLLLQNGFVRVWDQSGGAPKPPPLFGAEGGIGELAFAPDSRSILIRDAESRARLFDVATGKRIGPAPGQTGIAHIAFSPDGRHLAVAGTRGRIALWATPRPMQGTSQRLRLWVETLAGMELDEQQMIHTLEPDEVQRRRARLDELGGVPTAD